MRAWNTPPALRHDCVLEQGGALELAGKRSEVVADAAVECKCGPLLGSGRGRRRAGPPELAIRSQATT